jgi:hypothetical protein
LIRTQHIVCRSLLKSDSAVSRMRALEAIENESLIVILLPPSSRPILQPGLDGAAACHEYAELDAVSGL